MLYINRNTYLDYVGDRFYAADYDGETFEARTITLDGAYITTEYRGCYEVLTDYTT